MLPDNVVGIRAVGDVEDDDDVLVPAIDAARAQHDKIRLLSVLGQEFTGYEADAVWEDTKLGARTFTAYDKIAVVTRSLRRPRGSAADQRLITS